MACRDFQNRETHALGTPKMTLTPEMSVATQYGSHLPALLACIAVTDGPVLELGVGFFSTPHLHALCGAMGRKLMSVEDNQEWRELFETQYRSDDHYFLREALLDELAVGAPWSVVLIDHSPGGANRAAAFKALIDVAEFVVMHDAQKDAENFQHIEPILAGVRWHLCTTIFPHTLVASKHRRIPEVLKGM